MAEFSPPDIQKEIGKISTAKSGWSLELNFVAWGSYAPKYDIRTWSADHQKMGKGVTMTKEEMDAVMDPSLYTGRCAEQVERFLAEVRPLLADISKSDTEINL